MITHPKLGAITREFSLHNFLKTLEFLLRRMIGYKATPTNVLHAHL